MDAVANYANYYCNEMSVTTFGTVTTEAPIGRGTTVISTILGPSWPWRPDDLFNQNQDGYSPVEEPKPMVARVKKAEVELMPLKTKRQISLE